jgi:hypothetical protein
MKRKVPDIIAISFIFSFFIHAGCAKEYSYERTPVAVDTISTVNPYICPYCIGKDAQILARWSFHIENVLFCGAVDTARVNAERTAFTFFGPSNCSADTGIIISVYLNGNILNKDLFNISTQSGAFYYYDNIGHTTIFISRQYDFTVNVESYIHQTHIITGTFSGTVYRGNGGTSYVSSGKFKVRIP